MIYSKNFLLELDKSKDKTLYARITSLNYDETPREQIEGRTAQGSVNLDGASALRRTCSLTLVASDVNYNDYYWTLNTKFKLEIGVLNTIDSQYPDIIWFKQGIYLITSFSTSHSTNNFTISISGKDKMCLLNGEIGGTINSSTTFDTIREENKDGEWEIRKILVPEIIRNVVHVYGGEPYHNIIINDLDSYGLELLEYRYGEGIPMYLYREINSQIYHNILLDGSKECWVKNDKTGILTKKTLATLDNEEFETLVDPLVGSQQGSIIVFEDKEGATEYRIAKVDYGQTAGYRKTDLVYAGDLTANTGDNISSAVLDKIVDMLVEFEYFYDLDGRFVFQKKKSYLSTPWLPIADENNIQTVSSNEEPYVFSGGELISSFNNSPNILNLKNDFTVEGERAGAGDAKILVHMRYAIDQKPKRYTGIIVGPEYQEEIDRYNKKNGTTVKTKLKSETFISGKEYSVKESVNEVICDWREVIYQMAKDYMQYNFLDDFELLVARANPDFAYGYTSGRTGYEQYYTDILGFWRELFNPTLSKDIEELNESIKELSDKIDEKYRELSEITEEKATGWETKYVELKNQITFLEEELEKNKTLLEKKYTEREKFYDGSAQEKSFWNKQVFTAPEMLNFWFDFLDTSGELSKYSVKAIGQRTKAVKDSAITSIYFRETPNVIFVDSINENKQEDIGTFKYIQIPNMESVFSISAQGKSSKDKVDELLFKHSYCIDSASITALPVLYLEPNTNIYIYDNESGVNGSYTIGKLSLSLAYNGTMNITATKTPENLF